MSKDLTTPKSLIEDSMEKLHYESYEDWVKNFALNLENIWNESSAKELDPTLNQNYNRNEHSAIVIGRGPSLHKKHHLELLAESKYKGSIVCCDGILQKALESGVTPKKFPKFYVVTIDPYPLARKFYDNPIIGEYGEKINGIFSTIVTPSVVQRAREANIKIHWIHSLFDYNEGKKSFNQISALIVRAKNHKNGLPALQTGGNVGTSAWFVSWKILQCATVALIGINHAWEEDDPWDKIVSHGRSTAPEIFGKNILVEVDKTNPRFQKLFKKVYNHDFNCNCIVDPLFQFYSSALKEFISRSPNWLTTINATEGGSIFGDRITCKPLKTFLSEYSQ